MDINAHVIALNEERARAWEEGKRLLEDTEGKVMDAEQRQEWDRINAHIDELDSQRDSFVARETREVEAAKLREAQAAMFGEPRKAAVSGDAEFRAWLNAPKGSELANTPWEVDIRGAMKERELMRKGASAEEIRALAWDTGSVASAVPTTMQRSLYEYLEATVCMFRMPTTKISTSSGEPLLFPRNAAHGIATQVIAQGTAIGGTDPTFDRMQLDAFKYGQLVRVANEVLTDTVFDVGAFLGRDIGRAIGRLIDADLVVGSGSGEPNGVLTAIVGAGTIASGGSLIAPTYEKLIDLVYSVNDEYRSNGQAAFLTRDLTAGAFRKMRDGAGGTVGAVLWDPSLTSGIQNGQPDRFLGYPIYTDPNVASLASNAKVLAFGDFSAYYIRTVGSVMIERDESRYFDTDEVAFRGKWRVDGDLIDATAINIMKQSV